MLAGNKRNIVYIALALLLLLLLAFLLLRGEKEEGSSISSSESKKVEQLFAGIPQRGRILGRARETLVEFVDPQCPACARFSKKSLPKLIAGPVRRGQIQLELRLLDFLGPDSTKAALAGEAAAEQNRIWQFMELLYLNQGPAESGYINKAFINDIYDAIGVDKARAETAQKSKRLARRLTFDEALAEAISVRATPSFVLVGDKGDPAPVILKGLGYRDLLNAVYKARRGE